MANVTKTWSSLSLSSLKLVCSVGTWIKESDSTPCCPGLIGIWHSCWVSMLCLLLKLQFVHPNYDGIASFFFRSPWWGKWERIWFLGWTLLCKVGSLSNTVSWVLRFWKSLGGVWVLSLLLADVVSRKFWIYVSISAIHVEMFSCWISSSERTVC